MRKEHTLSQQCEAGNNQGTESSQRRRISRFPDDTREPGAGGRGLRSIGFRSVTYHERRVPYPSFALSAKEGGDFDFPIRHLLHLTIHHASRNFSNFDLLLVLTGNNFIDLYFRNSPTGNRYHASTGTTYATSKSISLARYTHAVFPCAWPP